MVLPFSSKSNNDAPVTNEPPRILTEEEQILMSIDQGVHEVKQTHVKWSFIKTFDFIFYFFVIYNIQIRCLVVFCVRECKIDSISKMHLVRIYALYNKMIDE